MYHLTVIKRNQFKIERATQLRNQALRIQMSTLGQYNPDTIDTQMEIAKVHLDSDLFDEAFYHRSKRPPYATQLFDLLDKGPIEVDIPTFLLFHYDLIPKS